MEKLLEKTLPTGEKLTIVHWSSQEKMPHRYFEYIMSSLGADHPDFNFYTQGGWRAYFNEVMNGELYPGNVDHWFIAEVDGVCAGRIWFAYESTSLWGNFGNVFTDPNYRKRGIMSELLHCCLAEFERSPAEMLCCCSGNKFAVASYVKAGFNLIYGGETGPLALTKKQDYLTLTAKLFDISPVVAIRPGAREDQFKCDKVLTYCPELWPVRGREFCGPGCKISEFRLAYSEVKAGHGKVLVALNDQQAAVGYAYAVLSDGLPIADFLIHPNYSATGVELLQQAVAEFKEMFPLRPAIYVRSDNEGKKRLIAAAGGQLVAQVADQVKLLSGTVGMDIYQF